MIVRQNQEEKIMGDIDKGSGVSERVEKEAIDAYSVAWEMERKMNQVLRACDRLVKDKSGYLSYHDANLFDMFSLEVERMKRRKRREISDRYDRMRRFAKAVAFKDGEVLKEIKLLNRAMIAINGHQVS